MLQSGSLMKAEGTNKFLKLNSDTEEKVWHSKSPDILWTRLLPALIFGVFIESLHIR